MDSRTSLINKNIFFSFILKGWSGLIYLMIVPITLSCLGEYKNGVWMTISSLLVWIDNFDIGLGNGLRNKLATALAHDNIEEGRKIVSSTFLMLVLVIIPITLLFILLISSIDIYGFLNVDEAEIDDLRNVVTVGAILMCTTFIFKFIGNFYLGLQLPYVNNLLITLGQTLCFIGTIIVYLSESHSLMMIAIVNTASPLIVYLAAYPYTFYYKYKELRPSLRLFKKNVVADLFSIGVKFFVLQISGVILFFSSNILISKLFNPALVTPYQIAYRYFSVILLLFTIVCTPYWTATTDAYERGDMEWIHKSKAKINKILMYIFAVEVLMVIVSPLVYYLWINVWMEKDVEIPLQLTVCMAVYVYVLVYSMAYSYFLNGIGKLHLQLIFTIIAAVVFIPLVIAATKISYSPIALYIVLILINLPGLFINRKQFNKIINGQARGIWNK